VLVLLLVLVISVGAVLALLVLPLVVRGRRLRQSPIPLLYFIALGLGYILVEIAFIQRFVLFLGHPTYALTVVIFLLMVSSGAGSLVSRRCLPRFEMGWIPLLLVLGILAFYVLFLPHWLAAWVGLDFGYRLLVSAAIVMPLGFLMGMPFPIGLGALAAAAAPAAAGERGREENAVEWAWAMNAAASVLGSGLAMVLAIQFGLTVTLACGAVAYVLALFILPVLGAKAA